MYNNFLCHKFISVKNRLIFYYTFLLCYHDFISCPVSIGYPWLRLIKSKEKNPLISYNPEYISETDHVQKNTYDSKNNYFYTYIFKMLDYYCKWILRPVFIVRSYFKIVLRR